MLLLPAYLALVSDNIKALVMNLDNKKLANFCRVLAVTISDLDIYENKSSCKERFHPASYIPTCFISRILYFDL